MKYILILFIINGYGSSSVTAEFNTKQACESAIIYSKSVYGDTDYKLGYMQGATGACLPKGLPEEKKSNNK